MGRKLSEIAKVQPYIAYCAFTHGLVGKWIYFLHTLLNISDLLRLLESTIFKEFIPAVTGRSASDLEICLPFQFDWVGLDYVIPLLLLILNLFCFGYFTFNS